MFDNERETEKNSNCFKLSFRFMNLNEKTALYNFNLPKLVSREKVKFFFPCNYYIKKYSTFLIAVLLGL